jgi:hypothetical protein
MTSRRASRRRAGAPETRRPIVVGENIVTTGLGQTYEAKATAQPPPKQAGRHRWIVTAAYTVNDDIAASAYDPAALKFLDHENLMYIGVGCVDCEQPLGAVEVGSFCPAGDEWPTR